MKFCRFVNLWVVGGNEACRGISVTEVRSLFEDNFDGVFRYCAYRLFRQDFAEDAASAVFVKLVEKYDTLKGKSEKEIRNWLYGAASNVVAGYLRDVKRQRKIFSAYSRQNKKFGLSGDNGNDEPDWVVLYQAVGKLSPRDQKIIALYYFEGLSPVKTAEILGLKNGTFRVGLSRATKRLRRKLGNNYGQK